MDVGELGGFFALGFSEKVVVLQTHPVFRLVAEVATQFQAVLVREQAAELLSGILISWRDQ